MARPQTDLYPSLEDAILDTKQGVVKHGMEVDTGTWQGVPTEGHPDLTTIELMDVHWMAPMPQTLVELRENVDANLPWADEHFAERVSRIPSNPGEAYKTWPWWSPEKEGVTQEGQKFTHTYQERIWPRRANRIPLMDSEMNVYQGSVNEGLRYEYGDLDDVVRLLYDIPTTRQAYLPIFFPEDTGAVHRGRTPCTLGYHFMKRQGMLHCWYTIRSCDIVRHYDDDIYLAVRLAMWVLGELKQTEATDFSGGRKRDWNHTRLGYLHFQCYSLHYHRGDGHLVRKFDPDEEPKGAGRDPWGRPDPGTHPEYWRE